MIYNEDCLDTMSRLKDGAVDLTVTSPPYDDMRTYDGHADFDFETIAAELYRVTAEGGVLVWIVADQTIKGNETCTSFQQALYFRQLGFNLFDTMIYVKPPRGATGNNKGYWNVFEYMFILAKGTPKTTNLLHDRENTRRKKPSLEKERTRTGEFILRQQKGSGKYGKRTNVWQYIDGGNNKKRMPDGSFQTVKHHGYDQFGRRTNIWYYVTGGRHSSSDKYGTMHPAIFPEKLAQDHIISWSNEGDLVYDPFAGSGTTAKMCIQNNRRYLGSEINAEYHAIAQARIKDCLGQVRLET